MASDQRGNRRGSERHRNRRENSLDYSPENTSRQPHWRIASRDAKYLAKSLVDTFDVRADDVVSAVITGLGAYFHFATSHSSMINVGLVACWIMALVCLARLCAQRSETSEKADAQGLAVT